VSYANVIDDDGDIRQGNSENCFFFVFEGREFLVEDQYCANPQCDCGNVHLEFWERVLTFRPRYRIQIVKRLQATFTLEGKLVETCFSKENASTTKYLLQAWVRRCSSQFAEYRRRYDAIKVIGARSFPLVTEARPPFETPTMSKSFLQIDAARHSMSEPRADGRVSESRVRRNDRCPCGSGRKFKRCCARRLTTNR
jgi:hypothetical protein